MLSRESSLFLVWCFMLSCNYARGGELNAAPGQATAQQSNQDPLPTQSRVMNLPVRLGENSESSTSLVVRVQIAFDRSGETFFVMYQPAVGPALVKTVGGETRLLTTEGKTQIPNEAEQALVRIPLVDPLENFPEAVRSAAQQHPQLAGKQPAQPSSAADSIAVLSYADPAQNGALVELAKTLVRHSQPLPLAEFKLAGRSLELLKNARRNELFLSFQTQVRCSWTDIEIKAYAQWTFDAIVEAASNMAGLPRGGSPSHYFYTGGSADVEKTLKNQIAGGVAIQILNKRGVSIPNELPAMLLDQLFKLTNKNIELNENTNKHLITIFVGGGDGLWFTTPVGSVASASKQLAKELETRGSDLLEQASRNANSDSFQSSFGIGSIVNMGMGVSSAADSMRSSKEFQERLQRDLTSVADQFSGADVLTVAEFDARSKEVLANRDVKSLSVELGNFSHGEVMWQSEVALDALERLDVIALELRSQTIQSSNRTLDLTARIESNLRRLQSLEDRSWTIARQYAAATHSDYLSLITAIQRLEGFRQWAAHLDAVLPGWRDAPSGPTGQEREYALAGGCKKRFEEFLDAEGRRANLHSDEVAKKQLEDKLANLLRELSGVLIERTATIQALNTDLTAMHAEIAKAEINPNLARILLAASPPDRRVGNEAVLQRLQRQFEQVFTNVQKQVNSLKIQVASLDAHPVPSVDNLMKTKNDLVDAASRVSVANGMAEWAGHVAATQIAVAASIFELHQRSGPHEGHATFANYKAHYEAQREEALTKLKSVGRSSEPDPIADKPLKDVLELLDQLRRHNEEILALATPADQFSH